MCPGQIGDTGFQNQNEFLVSTHSSRRATATSQSRHRESMAAMHQDPRPGSSLPLLFINKDATNLNRTPAEAFAIGSHMSKAYRKWAKIQRLGRVGSTARLPPPTKIHPKICPRTRQSLIEKCEEIEENENPQALAAVLKAAIHQVLSAHTESCIPTKLNHSHIHGHSPSLYRAMEYCMCTPR